MSLCNNKHDYLQFDVVQSCVKYTPPTQEAIRDALAVARPARKKTKKSKAAAKETETGSVPPESTFPAPVITPGDEIYHDPDYPPQSVQEWVDEEHRNEVTTKRKTVYVVPAPALPAALSHLDDWTLAEGKDGKPATGEAQRPQTEDILEYISAFYHGLPTKLLQNPTLEFTTWDDETAPKRSRAKGKKAAAAAIPPYIGLSTGSEVIRIRCRPSRDGIFAAQLNLEDLLDATISILPKDAYALVMLVDQDMYESEDDDFCCGRAYGGSRVAVVSTARYRPELDEVQKIDREHSWPASHCRRWVCGRYTRKAIAINYLDSTQDLATKHGSGIAAAVLASNALPSPSTAAQLSALWLGRVCKTASHELGHCFGIDHCMYYACPSMMCSIPFYSTVWSPVV